MELGVASIVSERVLSWMIRNRLNFEEKTVFFRRKTEQFVSFHRENFDTSSFDFKMAG